MAIFHYIPVKYGYILKDGIIRKMEEGTIINICIGVPGEGERIRNLTSLER